MVKISHTCKNDQAPPQKPSTVATTLCSLSLFLSGKLLVRRGRGSIVLADLVVAYVSTQIKFLSFLIFFNGNGDGEIFQCWFPSILLRWFHLQASLAMGFVSMHGIIVLVLMELMAMFLLIGPLTLSSSLVVHLALVKSLWGSLALSTPPQFRRACHVICPRSTRGQPWNVLDHSHTSTLDQWRCGRPGSTQFSTCLFPGKSLADGTCQRKAAWLILTPRRLLSRFVS